MIHLIALFASRLEFPTLADSFLFSLSFLVCGFPTRAYEISCLKQLIFIMSVYQYHPDNLYSFASADGHINPSNATHAVSNALPMPGGSIGTNVISNQGESNERTGSLQQIDHEVFKKKYFTDISVIDGKKYRFCKNVALNRCKDTRQGAQKGRYSSSTSGSILKRHVEVCLGIIFDAEKTPKRDLKQTPASSKKRHNENLFLDGGDKRPKKDTKSTTSPLKKGHNENLAHVIVENMVY